MMLYVGVTPATYSLTQLSGVMRNRPHAFDRMRRCLYVELLTDPRHMLYALNVTPPMADREAVQFRLHQYVGLIPEYPSEPFDTCLGEMPSGGVPLEGRLRMPHRVPLIVDDPSLPYLVRILVGAFQGQLVAQEVTLRSRHISVPITTEALRTIPVRAYLDAAMPRLGNELIVETGRDGNMVAFQGPPPKEDLEGLRAAGRKRIPPEDALPAVADAYRRGRSDPEWRHRPTAYVAKSLGYSHGHASRLVTAARNAGLLGAARKGQPGEIVGEPKTTRKQGKQGKQGGSK